MALLKRISSCGVGSSRQRPRIFGHCHNLGWAVRNLLRLEQATEAAKVVPAAIAALEQLGGLGDETQTEGEGKPDALGFA